MNITKPLRLAIGSHTSGSGKGCAMNVLSWENGDTTISDMPSCTDRFLARVVQRINDSICTHRQGDLLCPACSIRVLELAHRTVGTGGDVSSTRVGVWVQLAIEEAERVLPIFEARFPNDDRPRKAIEAAKRRDPAYAAAANADAAAAYAADAAAYAANVADAADAAYAAADAAANAAYAAANAADAAANAAYAAANADAAYAAYAAANAADANANASRRLAAAHRLIDRFYELTGLDEHDAPEPDVVSVAVERMLATA